MTYSQKLDKVIDLLGRAVAKKAGRKYALSSDYPKAAYHLRQAAENCDDEDAIGARFHIDIALKILR